MSIYNGREPKKNKQMKAVLEHTKRISKAELRLMISTAIKEMVRDEMRRFMREDSFMNDMFQNEFRNALGTDAFNRILTNVMEADIKRIRGIVEDIALTKAVKKSGFKSGGSRPTGRSRGIRL